MKKGKKTFYRKKPADLPKQANENRFEKFFESSIEPALKGENLRRHGLHFSILFLVILFVFSLIQATISYFNYVEYEKKHSAASVELAYWEQVVRQHPNSPDGYYNAALYAGMLGSNEKAIDFIERALILDPDFEEAKELEKVLAK